MLKVGLAASIIALALGGCAQKNSLIIAEERYHECLQHNAAAPDRCEALRRAYEAEFVDFRPRRGTGMIVRRR